MSTTQKRAAGKPQNKEAVHIACLQFENLKRVQAVEIVCEPTGLTLIGGRNGQGKTSVLDGIMWTLGGDRFRPSDPDRDGHEAATHIELSNGITVERKGKNGALKVMGPDGKGGQQLLNEFVNAFALNLPRFIVATPIEKARMLLDVFPGLGEQLDALNAEVKTLFDQRHALGQILQRKKKHAEDLPYIAGVPEEPLSGGDMTKRLQAAMSHNAENEARRRNVSQGRQNVARADEDVQRAKKRVTDLEQQLAESRDDLKHRTVQLDGMRRELAVAETETATLVDTDTATIQRELEEIDQVNAKVRQNHQKAAAEAEASELSDQYGAMSVKLDTVRAKRIQLLSAVDMPLDGLSIDEAGELVFAGRKWDGMSGSEQLRVAAAICAAVKPECGFVLLDKLEAMDIETLTEFGTWLRERGLQGIGTRVSTGDECSILIEDGMVATPETIKQRKEYSF